MENRGRGDGGRGDFPRKEGQANYGQKRLAEGGDLPGREVDLRNKLMKSKEDGMGRELSGDPRRQPSKDKPFNLD